MSKIQWEYDLVERPFCEQLDRELPLGIFSENLPPKNDPSGLAQATAGVEEAVTERRHPAVSPALAQRALSSVQSDLGQALHLRVWFRTIRALNRVRIAFICKAVCTAFSLSTIKARLELHSVLLWSISASALRKLSMAKKDCARRVITLPP
jgi:hypothetical protein